MDILQFWNVYRIVRTKDFMFLTRLGLAVRISTFGLCIIQLRKKQIEALAVVRVSSGYFTVLECISYSTQNGLHVYH